jgi:hypothetical protein
VQVEGISAYVRVVTQMENARVWALDETGARRVVVPSRLRGGVLQFALGPEWRTLWYEIQAVPRAVQDEVTILQP